MLPFRGDPRKGRSGTASRLFNEDVDDTPCVLQICKTETDKAADEMRLLLGEQVLEDSAIIKDCRIENAGLLYLVYKQDDDTWEEVNVFKPVYAQTEEDRQIDLPDQLVSYLDSLKP